MSRAGLRRKYKPGKSGAASNSNAQADKVIKMRTSHFDPAPHFPFPFHVSYILDKLNGALARILFVFQ